MEDYSLGLALFDFLPVLVSALGLLWLARMIGASVPTSYPACLFAVVLIASGGLCKASWKLTWVISQQDISVLDNLLFILMAPGMLLLALHCHTAQRQWRGVHASAHANRNALLLTALVYGLAVIFGAPASGGRGWFFILLAATALANIAISSLLIGQCWRVQQRGTAALFLLSICLVLGLSGLSRLSAGSAPLQWLAEILNLLAHGSFALAVWQLRAHIPTRAPAV